MGTEICGCLCLWWPLLQINKRELKGYYSNDSLHKSAPSGCKFGHSRCHFLVTLCLQCGHLGKHPDSRRKRVRQMIEHGNSHVAGWPNLKSFLFHLAEIMYPLLWQVTEAYFSFMYFFRCMVMVINVLVTVYVWL